MGPHLISRRAQREQPPKEGSGLFIGMANGSEAIRMASHTRVLVIAHTSLSKNPLYRLWRARSSVRDGSIRRWLPKCT